MSRVAGIVIFIICCGFVSCKEPQCSSFHYEEKLLEKMIRTEIKVEDLINTISQVEQRVNDSLEKMTESLQTEKSRLNDVHTSVTTAFKKSGRTDSIVHVIKLLFIDLCCQTINFGYYLLHSYCCRCILYQIGILKLQF